MNPAPYDSLCIVTTLRESAGVAQEKKDMIFKPHPFYIPICVLKIRQVINKSVFELAFSEKRYSDL